MAAAASPESTTVDFGSALSAVLRNYLAQAGAVVSEVPGGPRGYQVMTIAAAGACGNQAAIAESLGLDRTVMTYLVDDLEKAGLVERRPDPADRRARQVVMTPKGNTTLAAAAAKISEAERVVLGGLSDADAELFRALLGKISTSAGTSHTVGACEAARVVDSL